MSFSENQIASYNICVLHHIHSYLFLHHTIEQLTCVSALKEKIKDAHVAPSFLTKFYDIEAVEGVPVEFVCVCDGNPDPSVTWLLNGKEVECGSEILTRRQDDSAMLAFRYVCSCVLVKIFFFSGGRGGGNFLT